MNFKQKLFNKIQRKWFCERGEVHLVLCCKRVDQLLLVSEHLPSAGTSESKGAGRIVVVRDPSIMQVPALHLARLFLPAAKILLGKFRFALGLALALFFGKEQALARIGHQSHGLVRWLLLY